MKTNSGGDRDDHQRFKRKTEGQPPRRTAGHTTVNKTTSTNVPKHVPKNFLNKLAEMYTAEQELMGALLLAMQAANAKDLKRLLRIHLRETRGHMKLLEDVGKSLGRKLPSKSCKQMTNLIREGVKVIAKRLVCRDEDQELIEVGRKIEQFEVANYSPLCAEAERMGLTHENVLLTSILNQERRANELLGALGQGKGPLDRLVLASIARGSPPACRITTRRSRTDRHRSVPATPLP